MYELYCCFSYSDLRVETLALFLPDLSAKLLAASLELLLELSAVLHVGAFESSQLRIVLLQLSLEFAHSALTRLEHLQAQKSHN